MWEGWCGCRHVCDDQESHHEDLVEGDHVHEDHDNHLSASSSEDCLVMFFPFPHVRFVCIQSVLRLYSVAASSSVALYDLVWVSEVTPFFNDVNHFILATLTNYSMSDCVYPCSSKRIWLLLVLEVALHDRSVILFLCGTQVISCFLEFL